MSEIQSEHKGVQHDKWQHEPASSIHAAGLDRHRRGQQGTKDRGTTGDKRQRDMAQRTDTEGQQGTKDKRTTGDKRQRVVEDLSVFWKLPATLLDTRGSIF